LDKNKFIKTDATGPALIVDVEKSVILDKFLLDATSPALIVDVGKGV
jgi:hypothetical protein